MKQEYFEIVAANKMPADGLATSGARASVGMLLTYFPHAISRPAREEC